MLRIALRNLGDHKLRSLLLGLAIVAGVGFVTAAYVFTDSLSAAFRQAFAAGSDTVDIRITPAESENGGMEAFPRIPADVIEEVAATDGVEAAVPYLEGFVTIVREEEDPNPFGPPDFGMSWTGTGPFEIIEGREPRGEGEAMLDASTAETEGLAVGDELRVAGPGRAQEFTIVGTFGFQGGGGFGGASFVALTYDQAAQLLEVENQLTAIDVTLSEGADLETVLADLDSRLPDDVDAVDAREAAAEQAAELEEGLSFFNTFLLVFGAIALVVGAFVVYNAFRVVVAQRGRELALLRILGTTRGQLTSSVLAEAVIVGAVASAVGVGVGVLLAIGIRSLLASFGGDLPDAGLVVSTRTVVVGMVVGMITTLGSALVPALRTARIAPMEALRDQPELRPVKPWWAWIGGVILAGSVALVVTGVRRAGDQAAISGETGPLILIGIGCVVAFVGLFLVARALSRPVIGLLGSFARSTAAQLGRENARRTPRRTAVTASSLMIGLGLVATVAVLSRSVEDTILTAIEDAFPADAVITAAGFDPAGGVSPEVADLARTVPEVEAVGRLNAVQARVEGVGDMLAVGVEPDTVDVAIGTFDDVEGSWDRLGPETVAVQRIEADARGYSLGDTLDVTIGGETYPVEIVAIFDFAGGVSDAQSYYLAYDWVASFQDSPRDFTVTVTLDPEANLDEAMEALQDALAEFPSIQVTSVSQLADQVRSGLNAVVGMVAGLLLMSVVVAVVGIVLTLYLAVHERTRETGMLRAVGMTRRQVRRMIRFESVMIAVFGTLLGLALGLFCGWALAIGVVGEGVSLSVPWLWVAAGLLGAVIAGVAAAVIPARRAARLDVLQAIAYE